MKTSLLAVVCFVVVSSVFCARNPDRQQSRRRVAISCVRQTKIRYSTLRKYKNGDFSDTSDKSKCFLKCFGAKMGMFENDDGSYNINEDFIHTYLDDIIKDRSQIPTIVDKCKAADRGENTCDYSYNAYYCFYNATKDQPELIDTSESTFDTVLAEKFRSNPNFAIEDSDEDWIEQFVDEDDEVSVPQAST